MNQLVMNALAISPNSPLKRVQSCGASQYSQASSMETVPTDFVDGFGSEEDDSQEEVWGRLFPIGTSFTTMGVYCCMLVFHGVWPKELW